MGMKVVVKGVFVRVCNIQFPLIWVHLGHKRRSCTNAVELRTTNIEISRLVMGNKGKVLIMKDRVNYRSVQIKGIRYAPTSVSKNIDIGVFVLFLLKRYF